MTMIAMIVFSALVLMGTSHIAALRAMKQRQLRENPVPVRIRYPNGR